jgi:hypothetical protein
MNIEELIECDAAKLELMTDEQLLEHFKPMLDITRPERQTKTKTQEQTILQMNPQFAKGVALAKSLGIEIPVYRTKKK